MCALFSQQKSHIFSKKTFLLRKHDFSRKLEGGTGLQGVSSNLNLQGPKVTTQKCTTFFFFAVQKKTDLFCIGAAVRTGQEIQCLPYAESFLFEQMILIDVLNVAGSLSPPTIRMTNWAPITGAKTPLSQMLMFHIQQ